MAILCLANDIEGFKQRLSNILVAYRYDNTPVYARDLQAQGAMTALLKDAIKPNLVQTLKIPQPLCTEVHLQILHMGATRYKRLNWR